MSAVEQLVESSQVRTIADAIQKARSLMDGKRTLEVHMNTPVWLCLCLSAYVLIMLSRSYLQEVLTMLESEIDRTGSLDVVGCYKKSGFYARPRKLEVCVLRCLLPLVVW